MDIIGSIKNFINPKGKIVKVMRTTPKDLEKTPIAVKKSLGLRDAELQEKRETIDALKKKLAEFEGKETEEEKIIKDLLRQTVKTERVKRGRRLKEYFKKMGRIVSHDHKLYYDEKRTYPFLCGFEKEETESGFGYNLLLKSKDKKHEVRAVYKMPLEMIFHEPERLVSAIRHGVVRTRFDSKNIFHPPEFMNNPCAKCEYAQDYYTSISSIRKRYDDKMAGLNDHIDNLRMQLKDAGIREVKSQSRLKDAESAKDIADFRADLNESYTAGQIGKIRAMTSEHATLLLASQESEVNRILTQNLNSVLKKANKEMAKKLGVEIPKDVEERMREKVTKEIKKDLDLFYRMSPAKIETTKETLPPGTKKEEKVLK